MRHLFWISLASRLVTVYNFDEKQHGPEETDNCVSGTALTKSHEMIFFLCPSDGKQRPPRGSCSLQLAKSTRRTPTNCHMVQRFHGPVHVSGALKFIQRANCALVVNHE